MEMTNEEHDIQDAVAREWLEKNLKVEDIDLWESNYNYVCEMSTKEAKTIVLEGLIDKALLPENREETITDYLESASGEYGGLAAKAKEHGWKG